MSRSAVTTSVTLSTTRASAHNFPGSDLSANRLLLTRQMLVAPRPAHDSPVALAAPASLSRWHRRRTPGATARHRGARRAISRSRAVATPLTAAGVRAGSRSPRRRSRRCPTWVRAACVHAVWSRHSAARRRPAEPAQRSLVLAGFAAVDLGVNSG
jgi:hypothetical protein